MKEWWRICIRPNNVGMEVERVEWVHAVTGRRMQKLDRLGKAGLG